MSKENHEKIVAWVDEEIKKTQWETSQKAMRWNKGKIEWSLVEFKALEPMVKVLMFGAKKYDRDNWKLGLDRNKLLDSSMRHLVAIMAGEEIDAESGELHVGHLMCNLMFYSHQLTNPVKDDPRE